MLFTDTYKIIEAPVQADLRERGSKFMAYGYPVTDESEIKMLLTELKKQFPDATHHCYAYRLGVDGSRYRVNDDGEPAGTAGRPILRAMQSVGVTNMLLVVIRYFGGKLLGVPGLIQAYGQVAALALQQAHITEKEIMSCYQLLYTYETEGEAFRFLKQQQATILQHGLSEQGEPLLIFGVRLGRAEGVMNGVKDYHKLKVTYLYTQ